MCQGRWDTQHHTNTSRRRIYFIRNVGADFTEEKTFYLCPDNWVGFWGVEMRMGGYTGTWVTQWWGMDMRLHGTSSGNTKGTRLAGSECRWGKKLDTARHWNFLSKNNIMCTALSEIITIFNLVFLCVIKIFNTIYKYWVGEKIHSLFHKVALVVLNCLKFH